ncbi:MAG: hypothetical protein ACYTGV_06020, partial [Planctomycetota bacterium]
PEHLRDYPLLGRKASGDVVAPFFDGWYENGDGTVTYSFGFLNLNTEEIVDIPIGENNYVEPAEYNGGQPTHFPVYDRGGFHGRRERGSWGVTVPMGTEVWWTISHAGRSYSIPGRATSSAYELSFAPAAFGSQHPGIKFDEAGPESHGPHGVWAERIQASVGTPVTISAMVRDRGDRYEYETSMDVYPVRVEFLRHQGPADIEFDPALVSRVEGDPWGTATTQATFSEPGEYVVRIRVDNFGAPDSKFDNMCCWSSGYVPVTVR